MVLRWANFTKDLLKCGGLIVALVGLACLPVLVAQAVVVDGKGEKSEKDRKKELKEEALSRRSSTCTDKTYRVPAENAYFKLKNNEFTERLQDGTEITPRRGPSDSLAAQELLQMYSQCIHCKSDEALAVDARECAKSMQNMIDLRGVRQKEKREQTKKILEIVANTPKYISKAIDTIEDLRNLVDYFSDDDEEEELAFQPPGEVPYGFGPYPQEYRQPAEAPSLGSDKSLTEKAEVVPRDKKDFLGFGKKKKKDRASRKVPSSKGSGRGTLGGTVGGTAVGGGDAEPIEGRRPPSVGAVPSGSSPKYVGGTETGTDPLEQELLEELRGTDKNGKFPDRFKDRGIGPASGKLSGLNLLIRRCRRTIHKVYGRELRKEYERRL